MELLYLLFVYTLPFFGIAWCCPYKTDSDSDSKSPLSNLLGDLQFSAKLETIHKSLLGAVPISTFKSTIKPTGKPTSKSTIKSSTKPSIKPSIKPLAKPSLKPSLKPSSKSSVPTSQIVGPSNFCKKTKQAPLKSTAAGICAAYKSIKTNFIAALPLDDFSKSNLFGQAIRLAFHDAGEFDKKSTDKLRSDGCLSDDFTNKSLMLPTSLVNTVMEPMWQANCDKISRADFWVLFAILAIQAAEPTNTISIPFQYGRQDKISCNGGKGRLPGAQGGLGLIHKVFVNQMGLTMDDAVALLGGHTVGHVHMDPNASGYGFPGDPSVDVLINSWDQTPAIFDNNYYTSMIAVPWGETPAINADGTFDMTKNFWVIPQSGQQTIMLNTDMALGFNITLTGGNSPIGVPGQFCAPGLPPPMQCISPQVDATPPTYSLVQSFVNDNNVFLNAFAKSFQKMAAVGYGPTDLTSIDLTKC